MSRLSQIRARVKAFPEVLVVGSDTEFLLNEITRLEQEVRQERGDRIHQVHLKRILHEAIERGRWRGQELAWCNKDDDCHKLAEGVDLAMGDIYSYLAEKDPGGGPE
jgi:hypothetical protein